MNNKWKNWILAQVLNIVIWVIWELHMVISCHFSNNAIVHKCSFAKTHSKINILCCQKENLVMATN